MSGVGLGGGTSPTRGTCETRQILLAGVQGVFLGGLPFSPHLLSGPSHRSGYNLESDVKLNKKWVQKGINFGLVEEQHSCERLNVPCIYN